MPTTVLALLLAIVVPGATGSPSPLPSPAGSGSPRPPLQTIVVVKSTPYCTALEQHFNGALVPMLANDRVFAVVDTQLQDMNDMFDHPDYIDRFVKLRTKLVKETGELEQSLKPIQAEIDRLRESASLTTDAGAAQQMRDAASQLQEAYKHQFQVSTDLTSLAQSMMQYDVFRGPHPLGGWTPALQAMPEDAKDMKSWLHYDKQMQSIDGAENGAVDIALKIAQERCTQ